MPLVEDEVVHAAESLRKPGFAEEALPWIDAVYRFALRLTRGNEDRAHDLVQETYLRAYRHWETYTPGTSARSWLFTICRNVFLRGEEQRGRRRETLESELEYNTEAVASAVALDEIRSVDPERAFFDSFVDDEVLAAVEQLPDEFREAVVLSDIEGLSYNEIAEVLAVPIGTVKSRLYRGRRLLGQALRDYAVDMGYLRGVRS
jgi:RNA polymerase sigma-70 factor (ECF subfamily)